LITRNKFFKYKLPVMALVLLVACMAIPWPAAATSAPVVISVSPASGTSDGGTSVIITGTGFTGVSAVKFGSAAATFTVYSSTQINATSPDVNSLDLPESTPVDITVYSSGLASATSSNDQFTYIPAGFMGMNKGASVLTTALQGTDTGGLIFTMGNSIYDPPDGQTMIAPNGTATVSYNVYQIPAGATVTYARLYAYYCFSDSGKPAQASVALNGTTLKELNSYSDTEGMGSYNYPCGNISFDATGTVNKNGSYTAVLTNTAASGNIESFYGIGLLIIYHDPNGKPFEYWVNEGCDLIWPDSYITPQSLPQRPQPPPALPAAAPPILRRCQRLI
jgi:hypothetical protein